MTNSTTENCAAGDEPPDGRPDEELEAALLDRYQQAVESGDSQSCRELLEKHPELAAEFACLDQLMRLAEVAPDSEPTEASLPKSSRGPHAPAVDPSAEISTFGSDTGANFEKLRSFSKYTLLGQVGRGGMGLVFRASQADLERVVALKIILSGRLASEEEVRRFRQEAKATARLRHPGIVAIHDVGEAEGHHFFTMDYLEGGSLSQRLATGTMAPRVAAKIVAAIAEAVDYLHSQGIVHRDLKPSNILFDGGGRPYVTDFGIARVLRDDGGQTRTGEVMGTASYMPPEQACGAVREVSPKSDVYSLGAILYESLVGRPPFRGETFVETLLHVLEREPTSPRRLAPETPRELERICLTCLEKDPDDRYESAAAVALDLSRFLQGEPIEARSADLGQATRRIVRRNPSLVMHLAAIVVGSSILVLRYLLGIGDDAHYYSLQMIMIAWAALAWALHRAQQRAEVRSMVNTIWAIADPLLLTLLIHLGEPPRGTLITGYAVLIAGASLWLREEIVAAATLSSLFGYGLLLYLHPELSQPIHHPLILVVFLLVTGIIVGFQVGRLRALNRYFE